MVGRPVASVVRREGRRLMGASGKSGLDWRPKGGWWFGNRVIAVVEGCKVGEKETAGLGPAPLDGQERQRQNASNARSGSHQSVSPAHQRRRSSCFGLALILGPGYCLLGI